MKGSKTATNQYLRVNDKKLIEDAEKEEAHRGIWKEIFKIIMEENTNYDMEKEREVNAF